MPAAVCIGLGEDLTVTNNRINAQRQREGACCEIVMQSQKRLSFREAFCPLGCKTSTGPARKIGSGSCDQCVKFNAQTVVQQDMTSRLLIQTEDAVNLEASKKFIPTPPASPSGKTNRKMISTDKDAQCFVASIVHRQLTACTTHNFSFSSSCKCPSL
jgi:hypothetical protein